MISEMKAGQTVCQPLIVRTLRSGNSSNGGVFVRGTVEDNSGSMPFISFEQRIVDKLRSPDRTKSSVYLVTGKVDLSKYARDSLGMQIVIEKLEDLRSDDDISMLIPRGNFNLEQYKEKLSSLISKVKLPTLRSLLQRIFNPVFCERFYRAPAGMKMHHAYLGGLLHHTVDVAELALSMAQTIGHVDTDLVLAGALLHDIGKVKEISSNIGFPYTTEGKLLGHISLSVMIVREAAADLKMPDSSLQQLEHIILSHHGDREKGSPMECVTREAFIVHYADEVNAIMNQFDTADGKGQWCSNFMLHRDLFINS
ncbi:MAG: HD domain-containing protein [Succiniclasticum sp.]|nr:HD domain-containing protein [Succiniclasticum sp.]